jgi:hypothetical protein
MSLYRSAYLLLINVLRSYEIRCDKEENHIRGFEMLSDSLFPLSPSANHAVVPLFDEPVSLESDQPSLQHFEVVFVAMSVTTKYS